MPINPRLAGELWRHDKDPEVTFSRARRTAMTGVHLALIDDIETRWFKRNHQSLSHPCFSRH